MKKITFLLSLLSILAFKAFSQEVNNGYWHIDFALDETTVLPVTFLYKQKQLYVINAEERIEMSKLDFKNDSLFVSFKAFDSELTAKIINPNRVEGVWHNYAKGEGYSIPFEGMHKNSSRFPIQNPTVNVYGRWEVTFDYDTEAPSKAVGLFDEMETENTTENPLVKGTFLTETGDFRYLDGVVSSDSLLLSTFDGSHAFLFRSKLVKDTLWGEFRSGTHYSSNWYAIRNENFELRHPDSLTYLVNTDPIKFELIDLNNEKYTYPNEDTYGKVTLIQIMGTWCPNCLDESHYLSAQKTIYGDDLNIIAVTFEMPKTDEERIQRVKKYKENLGLDYTFLIGGGASKDHASELFPMLNDIISFPTLIFIDKKGEIRRIHTGFNGPGTGDYYQNFVKQTDRMLQALIEEKMN